jgi:hypothetical protein
MSRIINWEHEEQKGKTNVLTKHPQRATDILLCAADRIREFDHGLIWETAILF